MQRVMIRDVGVLSSQLGWNEKADTKVYAKEYAPKGCTKHRANECLVNLTRGTESSEQVDEVAHAVAENAGDQHEVVHVQIATGKEKIIYILEHCIYILWSLFSTLF